MKSNWAILLFLPLFPCALFADETDTRVDFHPEIIGVEEGAIQNAGSGTEIWRGGPHNGETRLVKTAVRVSDYSVNSMIRVNWSDYETKEGEYLFAKMDKHFDELLRDRWKLAPLVGEPLQALPKEGFVPYSHLIDQVTYLHPVVIRNCNVSNGTKSYINPAAYNAFADPQAMDNFHKMYTIIGYRYLFTSARITWQNDELVTAIDWLNIGLTPTYDEWKIRYFIEDEAEKKIWTGSSALDLRTVFPDENTPPGAVNSDRATTHTDRFTNVPRRGRLYLQIVDPCGVSPHMALSIKGRTEEGA